MRLWIDVLSPQFVTMGDGPISAIVSVQCAARLDQAGTWSATVAADARAVELCQEKRIVLIWGIDAGNAPELMGGGVIDEITALTGADDAPQLQIGGGDLLSVLAGVDAGIGEFTSTKAQILSRISSLAAAWSVIELDTIATWRVRLAHESVLAALVAATERRDFHFRWAPRGSDARRLELFSTPQDSGVTAFGDGDIEGNANGCRITRIEELRQAHDLKNNLYVYGAGNAEARLTLAAATQWPNGSSTSGSYFDGSGNQWTIDRSNSSIRCAASVTAYGQQDGVLEFGDIGPLSNNNADVTYASNFLLAAAVQAGRYMVAPQRSFRLSVAGLRTQLLPGEQIYVDIQRWVDGERPIDIRQFMIVLEVSRSIPQDGVATYELTVSTQAAWPVSDLGAMVRSVQAGVVSRAYPQLNANSYVLPFTKYIDGSASEIAAFRFRLGAEVTQLQQILFEFQALPLESTVRSVAASSTTSTSGGGSTQTSTFVAPNDYHAHNVPVGEVAGGPYGNAVHYSPTFGLNVVPGGGGGTGGTADPTSTNLNHAHDVTIPAHTHTVTPTINTVYGIYRESSGNTLDISEIEYRVNGGAWRSATEASDEGSGWKSLDVTTLLQDATTLRPLQENNLIEMRGTESRTATIDAQLSVRNVIQAIAYR